MLYRLKELNQIEQLIHQGSLKEALKRVSELEKQPNLSQEDLFECQLVTIDALIQLGSITEALNQIDLILELNTSIRIPFRALGLKCEAFFRLGKYDDSLAVISQLEVEMEKLMKEPQIEREYLSYMKGIILLGKGVNYLYKGNLDCALDFTKQSKKKFSQIDSKFRLAAIENVLGIIYDNKGDLSQGMKYYQHSLAISNEHGYKYLIFVTSNNIANIYRRKGDLTQALKFFQSQLAQFDEYDFTINRPAVFENIGYIYCQLGDLDQALKYLQESYDLFKKSQFKASVTPLASSARSIGKVYYLRGNSDQALKYYQDSLKLQEEVGNVHDIAITLLELILITIDHHSLELANQYLAQLQKINSQVNNVLINQRFRVAQALILKSKPRLRHNAKAQRILQQLLSEDIVENELSIFIMTNLCELLLDELKIYNEDEIFQEAKDLVQQLQDLAESQRLFPLIIDILILRSKFALVEGDLTQAATILDQAEMTAHEKSLGLLERKVIQETQLLEQQHQSWQDLITSNASFHDRINQAQLRDYIKVALQLKSKN
ncbi:MAG: tetratricopeptide repeat protein [Candidatus Hermodarchaeota archaeon]